MLSHKRTLRAFFIVFFVFELFLFFTGYFFYKDLPDPILHLVMMVCNTWYVASIYISLGLLLMDLVMLSNKIYPWYPEIIKKRLAKIKLVLFLTLIVFVTGLMIKAYHNAIYPVVRNVNIHVPKVAEWRDSLTIVLMSDLHISETVGKRNVQRFVELCNAEQPDIVVIAGDMLDYESLYAEKDNIEKDLQRLNAPLGVYMVLGNHEYRANRLAKFRWFEKTGAILLVDSVVMPDSTFYLIGRDDVVNPKRMSLESLMQDVDILKPVIVVEHQPDFAEDIIKNQCDLGLFGHTHNGQYWPFSLVLKLVFKFSYGYYSRENAHIYVSSGIGFAGPPYRVGTRAELVVIKLTMNN